MKYDVKKSDLVIEILEARGMIKRAKVLAHKYSLGRTSNIKKLSGDEIDKLFYSLNEMNDEVLLQAIYDCAFSLNVISTNKPTIQNDELIIGYLKSKGIIDFITNEIEATNPVCKVQISSPFVSLKFTVKELILSVFANILKQAIK